MRECPFCGNELPDRSRVCIYCGGALGNADDAGAAARKHRQIVLTLAAVGVFVVLVVVFSLLATVTSDGDDSGDNFVPGGYVFSSHTVSGSQIEGDESSVQSESGKGSSGSSASRRKNSGSSSKGSKNGSKNGGDETEISSSSDVPDSSYSSEPDIPSSSETPPESSSSAETPPESASETPPPESSDSGGFQPPPDD